MSKTVRAEVDEDGRFYRVLVLDADGYEIEE